MLITRRARDRRAQLKSSVRSSTRTRMANQDQAEENTLTRIDWCDSNVADWGHSGHVKVSFYLGSRSIENNFNLVKVSLT